MQAGVNETYVWFVMYIKTWQTSSLAGFLDRISYMFGASPAHYRDMYLHVITFMYM